MKTIYYFSGTGNSLWVTKKIKEKLGDTKLVSISSLVGDSIIEDNSSTIGFVFPVYIWNIPNIVRRFVKRLNVNESTYYFSVITCANSQGSTLLNLDKLLKRKNGKLSSGFALKMPSNYIVLGGAEGKEKINQCFSNAEMRINDIQEVIGKNKENKLETSNFFMRMIGNIIYKFSISHINKMDKNYWVDEKCNGCKICEQICPVDNIKMEAGKPKWLGHCEQCMSCIQYCPQESIQYGKNTKKRKRYKNPKINISEMMK